MIHKWFSLFSLFLVAVVVVAIDDIYDCADIRSSPPRTVSEGSAPHLVLTSIEALHARRHDKTFFQKEKKRKKHEEGKLHLLLWNKDAEMKARCILNQYYRWWLLISVCLSESSPNQIEKNFAVDDKFCVRFYLLKWALRFLFISLTIYRDKYYGK